MDLSHVLPGRPYPFGATLLPGGVNFCVYSHSATSVILEFYDHPADTRPSASFTFDSIKNRTGDVWHAFVPHVKAGALYLYRVAGPFDPAEGHRFDVRQRLFDPYVKCLTNDSVFKSLPSASDDTDDGANAGTASQISAFEEKEPAPPEPPEVRPLASFPKCVVIDEDSFDWQGDRPIGRSLSETVIYEVHLKGFTADPSSGVAEPGTYRGFIEKIPYLKSLGITAVELLPICEFDENENRAINPRTGERLKNFWGYSTIGFFAPKASYAADRVPGGAVNELKALVRELHKAGIEVILDVVYNHTAEGGEGGVTLNFRGFENSAYYMLSAQDKRRYVDLSGCGNTFNCNHPVARRLILDSLEHWVLDYHVDGFRFDLASILARDQDGLISRSSLLTEAIGSDPILANTKIIAEPWDAGGGYLLGGFPGLRWSEWNDRFRDDIRRFWRGDDHIAASAATRMCGSSDLFSASGRTPSHSINFVCCHDGFTLNDLVSYSQKHNEENGEGNRDGTDANWSANLGFEGAALNPVIERMRVRRIKNFMLTLFLSLGTPMLLGGDEARRTQRGNNNAFCQDNAISYFDWTLVERNAGLVSFCAKAIGFRSRHASFRRMEFLTGESAGCEADIQWYDKDGKYPDWSKLSSFLSFRLFSSDENDRDFFIAANAERAAVTVRLPHVEGGEMWYRIADTSIEGDDSLLTVDKAAPLATQASYTLPADSMLVLVAK